MIVLMIEAVITVETLVSSRPHGGTSQKIAVFILGQNLGTFTGCAGIVVVFSACPAMFPCSNLNRTGLFVFNLYLLTLIIISY
jgi:hypothetical protein